jgi:hypothetical protein
MRRANSSATSTTSSHRRAGHGMTLQVLAATGGTPIT